MLQYPQYPAGLSAARVLTTFNTGELQEEHAGH